MCIRDSAHTEPIDKFATNATIGKQSVAATFAATFAAAEAAWPADRSTSAHT